MDLLIKSINLLDDFLSQKSDILVDKDLASKDNSQAIFQALQQVAGYENQLKLADTVAKNPKWIEIIVSFAVTVFEGIAYVIDCVNSVYVEIYLNIHRIHTIPVDYVRPAKAWSFIMSYFTRRYDKELPNK